MMIINVSIENHLQMNASNYFVMCKSEMIFGEFRVKLQNFVSKHDKICRKLFNLAASIFYENISFPWFMGIKRYFNGVRY